MSALGATTAAGGAVGLAGGGEGTVQTLAGPGFCPGAARVDEASVAVEGLAVDASDTIHVATGPAANGLVVRVDGLGRTALFHAGGPVDAAAPLAAGPGGGRGRQVASDGDGGALIAIGDRLVQLNGGAQTTIAGEAASAAFGTGAASTGDGGPAREARFRRLVSFAADSAGNAYVADEIDPQAATMRIRFVNRSDQPRTFYGGTAHELTVGPGQIDTIAGAERSAAGGPASAPVAILAGTSPVLAALDDRLYIADHPPSAPAMPAPGRVRLINVGGAPLSAHGASLAPAAVATVAGDDRESGSGRSEPPGPGIGAVTGMAADDRGNLYLADRDHHRIVRVDPSGALTTFAGTGLAGFNGNGGSAAAAKLDRPFGVAVGPWGRIYLSDQGNGQVRYVDTDGIIHAAPGNGAGLRWTCEGASGGQDLPPEQPLPGGPSSVVSDGQGTIYVAASSLAQVKQITPSGRVTTLAGRRQRLTHCGPPLDCSDIGDGESPSEARLVRPSALAMRADGGLYIFDSGDARVRLVNLGPRPLTAHAVTVAPGTIATVAGNGSLGSSGDGGKATSAQLLDFGSLAADSQGNLFIADTTRVRRIDSDGIITTFLPPSSSGGAPRCCILPNGVAVDGAGNLFVADNATGHLWVLNRTATTLTTHGVSVAPASAEVITGHGGSGADDLVTPREVTVGHDGSLYIVGENIVQSVDAGGTRRTLAGSGPIGFNGDGLKARLTTFHFPTDVAIDRCGNIVVADQLNDRVRRVLVAPSCAPEPSTGAGGVGRSWIYAVVVAGLAVAGMAMASSRSRRRSRPLGAS